MQVPDYDPTFTSELVARCDNRPEMLVQILHGIVHKFSFVPKAAITQLANELNLSRADVHGVVSYYDDFRTERPGRHIVKLCQAEACQAMGSRELTRHAKQTLDLDLHESNASFTLLPVFCLGNCACSPAIMIDGHTYGNVNKERFDKLLRQFDLDDAGQQA